MMKTKKSIISIAMVTCMLCSNAVGGLGGLYRGNGLSDQYSKDGEVYYKAVSSTTTGNGKLLSSKSSTTWNTNLQIFDLQTGKSWKVFEKDLKKGFTIRELIFESTPVNSRFKNMPVKRVLKEKLLIVVRKVSDGTEVLWTTDKYGKGLKKVVAISGKQQWHIDLKHDKIRVFSKGTREYRMDEYPW